MSVTSEVRRARTYLRLTTLDQTLRSNLKRLPNLPSPLGDKPYKLQEPEHIVRDKYPTPAHPPHCEIIPSRLRFADITLEGVIPGDFVRAVGEIFFVQDVETDGFESGAGFVEVAHFGDTVSEFDLVSEFFVLGDRWVPRVSHAPFVYTEL